MSRFWRAMWWVVLGSCFFDLVNFTILNNLPNSTTWDRLLPLLCMAAKAVWLYVRKDRR